MDLSQAAEILDEMDSCGSLKDSYSYLDDLAKLTLCIIHSEKDDEVNQVSMIWREKIMAHMQIEVEPLAKAKSRKSIGRRRTSSTTVMTVLKEEKEEQVYILSDQILISS